MWAGEVRTRAVLFVTRRLLFGEVFFSVLSDLTLLLNALVCEMEREITSSLKKKIIPVKRKAMHSGHRRSVWHRHGGT